MSINPNHRVSERISSDRRRLSCVPPDLLLSNIFKLDPVSMHFNQLYDKCVKRRRWKIYRSPDMLPIQAVVKPGVSGGEGVKE